MSQPAATSTQKSSSPVQGHPALLLGRHLSFRHGIQREKVFVIRKPKTLAEPRKRLPAFWTGGLHPVTFCSPDQKLDVIIEKEKCLAFHPCDCPNYIHHGHVCLLPHLWISLPLEHRPLIWPLQLT